MLLGMYLGSLLSRCQLRFSRADPAPKFLLSLAGFFDCFIPEIEDRCASGLGIGGDQSIHSIIIWGRVAALKLPNDVLILL